MSLTIGDTIDGKYEIVGLLGEGGMGAVFEGVNTRIHRRVAIKVLHPGVSNNDEAMKRFEREAQAAGRIGSEHIVEVLDLGDLADGARYLVMEFLEGEALSDRIAQGKMTPREIVPMMIEMLQGLQAAHDAGIIHRDLKPDNVFLLSNRAGRPDFVKIVDFGISKFNFVGGDMSMTRTGAVMGTPYYMAPEQAKGGKGVDHRADLYAVGVILYQAVVGQVPFDAATFNELLFKIVLETPPALAERVPGIDPSFVEIVEKAMAREPEQRYATAAEFQLALQSWMGGVHAPAQKTISTGTPEGLDKTALPQPAVAMGTLLPDRSGAPGTVGEWARTGVDIADPVPVKKRSNLALLLGLAALVVAAALAAFFLGFGGNSAAEERANQAASQNEQDADEIERAAIDAEREGRTSDTEEKARQAEWARDQAELAREEAEAARDEAEKQSAGTDKGASRPSPAAAPAPRTTAVPRPVPRPPAPVPTPAPAPEPSGGGRPIRTDL